MHVVHEINEYRKENHEKSEVDEGRKFNDALTPEGDEQDQKGNNGIEEESPKNIQEHIRGKINSFPGLVLLFKKVHEWIIKEPVLI
ncbi:hypothetical protein GCM10010465_28260 [Actinomadura fibrosa]